MSIALTEVVDDVLLVPLRVVDAGLVRRASECGIEEQEVEVRALKLSNRLRSKLPDGSQVA
jgi:ribosomal protein L18E